MAISLPAGYILFVTVGIVKAWQAGPTLGFVVTLLLPPVLAAVLLTAQYLFNQGRP